MNYISLIGHIIETPIYYYFNNKQLLLIKMRVKINNYRYNRFNSIFSVLVWSKIQNKVQNDYCLNDYIVIEGYLNFCKNNFRDSLKLNTNFEVSAFRTCSIF